MHEAETPRATDAGSAARWVESAASPPAVSTADPAPRNSTGRARSHEETPAGPSVVAHVPVAAIAPSASTMSGIGPLGEPLANPIAAPESGVIGVSSTTSPVDVGDGSV